MQLKRILILLNGLHTEIVSYTGFLVTCMDCLVQVVCHWNFGPSNFGPGDQFCH